MGVNIPYKIMIVTSDQYIFKKIGYELYVRIKKKSNVKIYSEKTNISFFELIKYRIKKNGILNAIDQILFKVYDLFYLRKKFIKKLKTNERLSFPKLKNINSNYAIDKFKNYDFVIAIATSIVKEKSLDAPKIGIINLHPGVLPQYRGIGNFWAIYNNDLNNIGCTCHWMTEKIDFGNIISISKLNIDKRMNTLWEINYNSFMKGIDDLSLIINSKQISTKLSFDKKNSKYYTWNGISHYIKANKILRNEI